MNGTEWGNANQRYLAAEVAAVRRLLEQRLAGEPLPAEREVTRWDGDPAKPSNLLAMTTAFGLSPFERDLLLLCVGCALDAAFGALCARLAGEAGQAHPSFSLAFSALPGGHWSATSPAGPLRHWALLELASGAATPGAPLRVDERVLHHLAGVNYLDERLAPIVRTPRVDPPSEAARALARKLLADTLPGAALGVQLCGGEPASQVEVAAALSEMASVPLYALPQANIPAASADRLAFARLWDREAVLTSAVVFLPCESDGAAAVAGLVDLLQGSVIVATREPLLTNRPLAMVDVTPPRWRTNGAERRQSAMTPRDDGLAMLAQHIVPRATWDDLVLPPEQIALLRQIAGQVRSAGKVYEEWGFAARSNRGLGISALFAGQSGTGKTMAAEVLAAELHRDLYRIDLSAVVSKYIGETEKNLRSVFDAAERTGAILLFDEADALFGKRSEVKDSHDRYANIEVSFLLQRMETYTGLAILTTNFRSALDPAFSRRIRFVVNFPFPDAGGRLEIWRRVFPPALPLDGLDIGRLSRLALPGGSIRNIAVNAAFLAADEGAAVGMAHVLQAARAEYAKLERPQGEIDLVSRS